MESDEANRADGRNGRAFTSKIEPLMSPLFRPPPDRLIRPQQPTEPCHRSPPQHCIVPLLLDVALHDAWRCSPGVLPLRDLNVAFVTGEQGERGHRAADLRSKGGDAQACHIDGGPALAVVLHPEQRLYTR